MIDKKELLRCAVLDFLVARELTIQRFSAIRRLVGYEVPFKFTDEELVAALEYQRQGGYISKIDNEDGPSTLWQATRAGVQRVERGLNSPNPPAL